MDFIKNKANEFKESVIGDKWGHFNFLARVHSDIQKDMTSDFILAKFPEEKRVVVAELVRDAYFIQKEIEKLTKSWDYKIGKNGHYLKNEDGTYKKIELSETKKNYIILVAKITFNSYMIKLIVTAIMNRNLDKNVMLELMTQKDQLEQENADLGEGASKLKEKLRNEEK